MAEPKLWDYREPRWGWDALFGARKPASGDWVVFETMGFGTGLSEGDYVALAGPAYRAGNKEAASVYKLTMLEYMSDPPDMWKAVLVFDGDGKAPKEFAKLSVDQVFFVRSDR